MSQIKTVSQLHASTLDELELQAALRRAVQQSFDEAWRSATPQLALEKLGASHSHALEEIGLAEEAARLRAFARVVLADLQRIVAEAEQLEVRLLSRAPCTVAQSVSSTSTRSPQPPRSSVRPRVQAIR